MPFRIKNWKLSVLALIIMSLFISLGIWQLFRAQEKERLLTSYHNRLQAQPLLYDHLRGTTDVRFYRAELTGYFDNRHTILLDNKIFHGRVGYEVYTPFKADGIDKPILIDRGFIPMGEHRDKLPGIDTIIGKVKVIGMLNLPPTYVALGKMEEPSSAWPRRLEYINLEAISKLLDYSIYPYVLSIEPKNLAAYNIEWQIVTMPPEKHKGYAVQWFALAFTLLILFVVLNRGQIR